MVRRTAGLLAVALAAGALGCPPAALAGGGPVKRAGGIPRDPGFVEKVNAAVDRGVLWVVRTQDVGGAFSRGGPGYPFLPPYDLGIQGLALYTVRACGLSPEDPVARLGLKRMRQIYEADRRSRTGLQNYSVCLCLLALDAYYAPSGEEDATDRYGRSLRPRRNIPEADLAWIRELVAWICGAQTKDGSFGYTNPRTSWEDHSNAQFSLLALKAARRCGVEVPKPVFRRALDHFLGCQEEKGPDVARREGPAPDERGYAGRAPSAPRDRARGWQYKCGGRGGDFATGSMTAAGVSSLVICRGELQGTQGYDAALDARVVQAIRDGIAWLGRNFSVTGNPMGRALANPYGMWHFYYLYGLERAGVMAGVSWMADRDWYGEGATWLLGAQNGAGAWGAGFRSPRVPGAPGPEAGAAGPGPGDLLDTCFALLFLKKATFRVEGAVATEEADSDLDFGGVADLDDASFRAVFDTVFGRYARSPAEKRSERVVDFVRMGTRAVPLLILRLEDADAAARAAAVEALARLTGSTLGFRAEDPEEARASAVAAWEEWWFARRRRLAPDVGAGRFREAGPPR